jgi:hypothetical protein
MSAPSPAPAPSAPAAPANPPAQHIVLRLLGVATCVAVGFVVVWQGFGLAGYGTDAHAHRVHWVCIQMIGVGLAVVVMKGFSVRVLVAVVFFSSACWAWWSVRSSGREGMSLGHAVHERDRFREQLATAQIENVESYEGLRGIDRLVELYPSLAAGLGEDYARWKANTTDEVVARFGRADLNDFKTVTALRATGKALAEVHPPGAERLNDAFWQWIAKARIAKTDELIRLPFGDWAAFDRTAPGRKALAEAFPETRDALVQTENDWVDSSIELTVSRNQTPKPGEQPPRRAFWVQAHTDVLALKALDPEGGRFAKARLRLFVVAHTAAQTEVTARLDAGQYDLAFGIARTHAVEWNATAAVLGAEEVKKLDSLRETCEFFDKLASKAAKPVDPAEIAPPPRTKPD